MSRRPKYCNPSDEVVIDPVYCPEVVVDYCSHGSDVGRKSRTTAVRKHLSSIGWRFYYAPIKSGTKRELKYRSPAGRIFHTLITACQSCLHEHVAGSIPIKRKRQSQSSKRDKRKKTDDLVSSQSSDSGEHEEISSKNAHVAFTAAMLRAFEEEQLVEEEAEFIDQEKIWLIDELFESLNVQAKTKKL